MTRFRALRLRLVGDLGLRALAVAHQSDLLAGSGCRESNTSIKRISRRAREGDWVIEVRRIGYHPESVPVSVRDASVHRDVYLQPLPVSLRALVVFGEDEATRIIRNAIARKNDVLSRIHDYRYDAYTKLVIRDAAKSRDSAEAVFLITETQTTAYWEQPDRYQKVITARYQSRNLTAEDNLVSVGQIVRSSGSVCCRYSRDDY